MIAYLTKLASLKSKLEDLRSELDKETSYVLRNKLRNRIVIVQKAIESEEKHPTTLKGEEIAC